MVIFSDNLIHDCLLGINDVERLNFLDKSWPKPLQISTINSVTPHRDSINKPITSAAEARNVLVAHFRDVIKDTLNDQPMTGPPMDITFDPMLTPVPKRFNYVKQTPLHLKKSAQDVIDELIEKRIIVPVKEPTDWCAPAFFVPKPDGRARLVTNYTYINQFIKRPVHPFPSPKAILQSLLPDSTCFIVMDCRHGYYQMGLSEDASYKTTFLLESGRYRYLRGPMGLCTTGDEWCLRSDAVVEGLSYASKIVDDILIQGPNWPETLSRAEVVLKRCAENNMSISLKSSHVGKRYILQE